MSSLQIHERHTFPEVEADEVYLVSYPRSGNTWLRGMLTTLLCGVAVTPELIQAVVPDVYKSHLAGTPKPRIKPMVIKTHSPYLSFPARVIYLVREGRDVLHSYYHYARNLPPPNLFNDFHTVQDFFFRDDLWPSPWHKHVEGWLDGLSTWPRKQYLLIKYEELLLSPDTCLQSIAEFIGIDVAPHELARAVVLNSKERMREIEEATGKGSLNFISAVQKGSETALSEEEQARYEAIAGEVLERLGYPTSGSIPNPSTTEPKDRAEDSKPLV